MGRDTGHKHMHRPLWSSHPNKQMVGVSNCGANDGSQTLMLATTAANERSEEWRLFWEQCSSVSMPSVARARC